MPPYTGNRTMNAQQDTRLSVPELADKYRALYGDRIDCKTIHALLYRFCLLDDDVTPCRVMNQGDALILINKFYPTRSEHPFTYETIADETGKSVGYVRNVFIKHRDSLIEGEDYWKGAVFKHPDVMRRSSAYIFSKEGKQKIVDIIQPTEPIAQPELDLDMKISVSVKRVQRLAELLAQAAHEFKCLAEAI